jgi:hypothetical protein
VRGRCCCAPRASSVSHLHRPRPQPPAVREAVVQRWRGMLDSQQKWKVLVEVVEEEVQVGGVVGRPQWGWFMPGLPVCCCCLPAQLRSSGAPLTLTTRPHPPHPATLCGPAGAGARRQEGRRVAARGQGHAEEHQGHCVHLCLPAAGHGGVQKNEPLAQGACAVDRGGGMAG